jgi:hypothetical protein
LNNKGTIIQSTIRPATSGDTFPVVFANEIKGGFQNYSTLTERDNIPQERRQPWMKVTVGAITFLLSGGTDNSNWVVEETPSLTLSNDPYSNAWSTDIISGATRQAIYNVISPIQTIVSGLTSNYIPFSGTNYNLTKTNNTTALNNGTNLLLDITNAKLKTPNGLPLSSSNRAVIYLWSGTYDLGSNIIMLDQYVDIQGVGDPREIIITSSNSSGTTFISNTNDYCLKNLSIKNTNSGGSIIHNTGQTDNGIWDNLILYNHNTENTTFNGTYKYIYGLSYNILNGNISGFVKDCTFSSQSCGFSTTSDITISGIIDSCNVTNLSIGVTLHGSVMIYGTINNCLGNSYNNFGSTLGGVGNVYISGNITNCKSGAYSFGTCFSYGDVIIDGNIINCLSVSAKSFGFSSHGSTTISGNIKNCLGEDYSFGSSFTGSTISGIIDSCNGGQYSFGVSNNDGNVIISGNIINCIGNIFSFGSVGINGNVNISGIIQNCNGGVFSFGGVNGTGDITISGLIQNCYSNSYAFGINVNGNINLTSTGIIDGCNTPQNGFLVVLGGVSGNTITINGIIENCNGGGSSFGSSGNADINLMGKINNCNGISQSFINTGNGSINISGLISNCNGTSQSFGYCGANFSTLSISGQILNCNGSDVSFGYLNILNTNTPNISGLIQNCNAGIDSFGKTVVGGILKNNKGIYNRYIQQGLIDSCTFINQSGSTFDCIILGPSGTTKYSTFIQLEPTKDTIKTTSSAIVSIYHCALNKNINVVSGLSYTNNITTPYNVVDINIIN